jgi:hypothetical protein
MWGNNEDHLSSATRNAVGGKIFYQEGYSLEFASFDEINFAKI